MSKGFSLIEVILAAALFGIYASVLLGMLAYGNETAVRAGDHARSVFLAEEGLEATRSLRSVSWGSISDGQWGLASTPSGWALLVSGDSVGKFNRQIVVSSLDNSTKKIISTVSWLQGGTSVTTTLSTLLTNWTSVTSSLCVAP